MKRIFPDISRELEVACYTALPVACVKAQSIDVLDVYELDLLRYVTWYCQWVERLHPTNVENVVRFFRWMELKVHFHMNAQITLDR